MSAPNGWASPGGSGSDDAFWRRPAGSGADPTHGGPRVSTGPSGPDPSGQSYAGPPRMNRPSAAVGWGPVITPGPTPRSLPPQDHAALDQEEAQARAVTVGVGVATLIVLFLLLVMVVIRAGAATV